jgi:hypothetical protein
MRALITVTRGLGALGLLGPSPSAQLYSIQEVLSSYSAEVAKIIKVTNSIKSAD